MTETVEIKLMGDESPWKRSRGLRQSLWACPVISSPVSDCSFSEENKAAER